MTESQIKLVNQYLIQVPSSKFVNSICDIGNDANKSFYYDSSSDCSMTNEDLLIMEIKQLKRQNTFLKGKIQQFRKYNSLVKTSHNKQLLKGKKVQKTKIFENKNKPKQFSLKLILKQIQSILTSLAKIHKLELKQSIKIIDEPSTEQVELKSTAIKTEKQYKQKILRELQSILLANEQTQYQSLLELFTNFYQIKTQEQRQIQQKLQQYIEKTISITKQLIDGINLKVSEKKLRFSCVYTTNQINMNTHHQDMSTNNSFLFSKTGFAQKYNCNQLSHSTFNHFTQNIDSNWKLSDELQISERGD